MGKYRGLAPEELDTADTLEEADYLLEEYQLAFGSTWEVWKESIPFENNPCCQCYRRRNPRVRIVDRGEGGKYKAEVGRCEMLENGRVCGAPTREGKRLCPDHIEKGSYIQRIAAKQLEMAAADKAAAKGKIKLSDKDIITNETVRELLLMLELSGPKTIERLVRELNRDQNVVEAYVAALKKKKLVKTKLNKRGSTMVFLSTQM